MAVSISSHHTIYYSNRTHIPIRELAESLVGLEHVVQHTLPVFQTLCPDSGLVELQVFIEALTAGSLKDNFLVKFIFKDQDGLDRFIQKMRENTGIERMNEKFPTVGPIIMIALLIGGTAAVTRMCGKDPAHSVNIRGNSNVVLTAGAGALNIAPDVFRDIVERNLHCGARLASHAARVIRPAKDDENAVIQVDGEEGLTIQSASIKEVPERVGRGEPEQTQRLFENEEVVIRAADLDNLQKGWAVVVPGLSNRRVKLSVDPSIDTSRLMTSGPIRADVECYFVTRDNGDLALTNAYLRAVREPPPSQPPPPKK